MVRKGFSCIELYKHTLVSSSNCLLEFLRKFLYLYERQRLPISLILLDISNLAEINKRFGYHRGNELLLEIASIIENSIRKSDVAGKYKSGSFLLILPNADREGAYKVANRLKLRFNTLSVEVYKVGIKMVIHSFIPNGVRAEDVLDMLERSLVNDRFKEGEDIIFVEEEVKPSKVGYSILLKAVQDGSIEPAFQPIYRVGGGIEGYEVLMRLIREDGSVIPAGCFIDELLKTSFISLSEEMVIHKAFLKLKSMGFSGKIFINFPYSFINFISKGKVKISNFYKELLSHGIEPQRIVVELPESKITTTTEELLELVKELRSYGFSIAVDDFGIENSSVERLMKTKPDIVKLDGFFLREGRNLLKWVVLGMKRMGFSVLLEQVETAEGYEIAKNLKVDFAQGYYLGEPKLL